MSLRPNTKIVPKKARLLRNKYLFAELREIEVQAQREKVFTPWDGKDEPDFEVPTPWDGKR